MKLFFISFIIASTCLAHTHSESEESHNWLYDDQAFEYTENQPVEEHIGYSNEDIVSLMNKAYLKDKLQQFSGSKPFILDGKPYLIKERGSKKGRTLTYQFLSKEFKSLGYDISFEEFGNKKGVNFIAQKNGVKEKRARTLILSFHLDSVGNAGANDDGTGAIAALFIAKSLAQVRHKHNLRIVGFDLEENGLLGSKAYVKKLKKTNIIADIQLEMMGTDSDKDGGFHVIDCKKEHSLFLTNKIKKVLKIKKVPLKIVPACTGRSDHASFWKKGIPAIVISENFFGNDYDKCYHRPCDIVDERIDFNYIRNIASTIRETVHQILVPIKTRR